MKKKMMIALLGLALVLYGCGRGESETAADGSAQMDTLPANLVVKTAPQGAQDIPAAKASAKEGQPIVIKGKIAGNERPLADSRAIMTILDPTVKTCDTMPGDACVTPWDACCEPIEVRTAKSATVQVVGADGKPLKTTLKGVGGLEPLKQVIVSGVAKSAGDALVVEAKEIYVQP
jgi:hypothetical protein